MIVTLGYAIAFAGLAIAIAAIVVLSPRATNYPAANRVMAKFLEEGRVDSLAKMCAVAPKTYFGALAAAIETLRAGGDGHTATAAFDDRAKALVAVEHRLVLLGMVGVLAASVGPALAIAGHAKLGAPLGLAGTGMFFAFMLLRQHGLFTGAIGAARHHLLPGVIAALTPRPRDDN